MNFAKQHFVRYAGSSYQGGYEVHRYEYGALRNVFADKACNYSYREFWF